MASSKVTYRGTHVAVMEHASMIGTSQADKYTRMERYMIDDFTNLDGGFFNIAIWRLGSSRCIYTA